MTCNKQLAYLSIFETELKHYVPNPHIPVHSVFGAVELLATVFS